jgi:hypothetical protein
MGPGSADRREVLPHTVNGPAVYIRADSEYTCRSDNRHTRIDNGGRRTACGATLQEPHPPPISQNPPQFDRAEIYPYYMMVLVSSLRELT